MLDAKWPFHISFDNPNYNQLHNKIVTVILFCHCAKNAKKDFDNVYEMEMLKLL
jgi:hypothetical protein